MRTAAGGATDEEIRTDVEFLGRTWDTIRGTSEQRRAPSLLHRDLNLVQRILRDYLSDDYVRHLARQRGGVQPRSSNSSAASSPSWSRA